MADWDVDSETPIQDHPAPTSVRIPAAQNATPSSNEWEVAGETPASHWYSGLIRPVTAGMEVAQENMEKVRRGAGQFATESNFDPNQSQWENVKRLGYQEWERAKGVYNMGTGAWGYLTSPVGGLARAGAEALTTQPGKAIGSPTLQKAEPYAEFALNMILPSKLGKMAERTALPEEPPLMAPPPTPVRPTAQKAQEISEGLAGDRATVSSPVEAGNTIQGELVAAQQQAQRNLQATQNAAESEANAVRGMQEDQGRAIAQSIQGPHPEVTPNETGEFVGQGVRQRAYQARANVQAKYGEAYDKQGNLNAGAVQNVGQQVKSRLTYDADPVIIDDATTPMANRAITDLDNLSRFRIANRADPAGPPDPNAVVAVDLRGIEQARKRLNLLYATARRSNNPSDARAMSRVIDAFDDHVEQSIANGMFEGDPTALDAIRQARAAHASYAQQFRPQFSGDDAGLAIRRIIDRNATPEEISNMILGANQVNGSGVRLVDKLKGILGEDGQEWNAIRQSLWQRASNPHTPSGALMDQAKIASRIDQFAESTIAKRVFTDQERAAFHAHAGGIRDLEQTIMNLPETQAATNAANDYAALFSGEGIGGAQATAFRKMVEGTATPEESAHAIMGAIAARGNPGNVSRMIDAIGRITGRDSDTWAAIRQGVWQKLAEGVGNPAANQKVGRALDDFLNGRGKSIATKLYDKDELAQMQRFADAAKNSQPVGLFGRAVASFLARTGAHMAAHAVLPGPAGYAAGRAAGWAVDRALEGRAGLRQ